MTSWPEDLSKFQRPEPVASIAWIADYGRSGSKPLKVVASNAKEYWVKTPYNPHGQESLLAEAICYATAEFLGVSAPSRDFLVINETLAKTNVLHNAHTIYPGTGLGSEVVNGVFETRELDFISKDDNATHGPKFIALWELCEGGDEQFLYRINDDYSLVPYDYGMWLGIEHDPYVERMPNLPSRVTRWTGGVARMNAGTFRRMAQEVGSMSRTDALQIAAQVPVDWGFTDQELISVAQWLYSRKNEVAKSLLVHAGQARGE